MIQNEYNFWKYFANDSPVDIISVGESFCDNKYDISRADSDLNAFEFILEGEGILEINNQFLKPQKNDVFLLTKGSCHRYYCNSDKPWHKLFVIFRGSIVNALIRAYLPENVYLFNNCDLKDNFYSCLAVAKNSDLSYIEKDELITVELIKIFQYLHNRNQRESCLAVRIKSKLDYYADKPFDMEFLCKEFNYSKNHIINVFSKKYGVTPYAYYNEKRISVAKYYLKNTDISIKSLAQLLSYTDSQYFSNCFKKATNKTPVQYRTQQG